MTAALRTDPDGTERYAATAQFLRRERRHGRLHLVASDGQTVELPDRLAEVLDDAAEALATGDDVRVVPAERLLTSTQAAEVLGISRPTMVRLLAQGELSYAQPGTHRRLKLSDVLAYRDERRKRRAALEDMTEVSVEAGFYDLLEDQESGIA